VGLQREADQRENDTKSCDVDRCRELSEVVPLAIETLRVRTVTASMLF